MSSARAGSVDLESAVEGAVGVGRTGWWPCSPGSPASGPGRGEMGKAFLCLFGGVSRWV